MLRKNLFILILPFCLFSAFGQSSNKELGDEYFLRGDYDKALTYYELFLKEGGDVHLFYDNYYRSLLNMGDLEKAEKSIKALKKKYPGELDFSIDQLLVIKLAGKEKEYQKEEKVFIDEVAPFQVWVESSARHLIKRRDFEFAEKLYLVSRKTLQGPILYAQHLIVLYIISGQKIKMLDEGLNLVGVEAAFTNFVEDKFQDQIGDPEVDKYLENQLIVNLQKDPESLGYTKLLVWFYVQKKDFKSAFIQSRSIDKRLKLKGRDLMDLGQIFFENKAFQQSVELFKYVADEYPESEYFPEAKRMEITSREELAINTFPVDTTQIKIILREYQYLVVKIGKKRSSAEALRRMALLYAFHLSEFDTAINLLQDAILVPRTPRIFSGRCKLDMGDIYLLKNESWESKLLYAQVEKGYKDQPIGHEGKFRLAKAYYYNGDFDLAKANLDILKRATTRQIANDAMELSLLIQNNSALDTSFDALKQFAALDLQFFCQQYLQAKEGFEELLKAFPNHSLTDETYFKLARISEKTGQYEKAISYLDLIISEYSDEILIDDALYLKAKIYEEKIGEEERAMETYKIILFEHPGSFYAEDARRKFRELRGDQFN